jgi:hypothetical protein
MEFVPGIEVSRSLYEEVVGPVLRERFAGLRHAAGLLDGGSEVLGFDTARSTDHDWGARLQVFLADADADPATVEAVVAVIGGALPATVRGVPARFGLADDTRLGVADPAGLRHDVAVVPVGAWLRGHLGFDPRAGVTVDDWLATPAQLLAVVTGGALFHDGLGDLTAVRAALAWPPDDVWRHLLAAQWTRIGQEEPFVGRCGEVGDDLGSAVIAARLARDHMRLALLLRRRYPPYAKWFGSAFARLAADDAGVAGVAGALAAAVGADAWPERERHLVDAGVALGALTNAAGLAAPVDPTPRPFHDRPFTVVDAERFAVALRESIADPALRALPPTGAIDQWVDSTDVLSRVGRARGATHGLLTHARPNDR